MDNLIAVEDIREEMLSGQSLNIPIPITEDVWKRIRKETMFILLQISNRCNMNCRVCINSTPDGKFDFSELRVEDIKYILERIGRNKKVCFTGGEPTLNEDIFEFIRLTKDSGNIPVLFTNGIRLADFDYTKKLVQSGLKKLFLSIDGLTPSIDEYFTGDRNLLSYKLEALENLKKLKTLKVHLSARVARGIGEDQIEEMLKFAIVNNGLIKGIQFCGAKQGGWWNIPDNCAIEGYDLFSLLEKATKGRLSYEYFFEFKRLKRNLDALMHRIGSHFPCKGNMFASINNKGILGELISTEELKAINKHLEDKKYYRLIKYLFRYKDLVGMLYRKVFKPATIEFEFFKRRTLQIQLCELKYACKEELEVIPIVKQEGNLKIFGYVTYT
jgi:organic radical activating enzyme